MRIESKISLKVYNINNTKNLALCQAEKKRKRHKIATHKRKKRLRKNRHKKK